MWITVNKILSDFRRTTAMIEEVSEDQEDNCSGGGGEWGSEGQLQGWGRWVRVRSTTVGVEEVSAVRRTTAGVGRWVRVRRTTAGVGEVNEDQEDNCRGGGGEWGSEGQLHGMGRLSSEGHTIDALVRLASLIHKGVLNMRVSLKFSKIEFWNIRMCLQRE